MSRPDTPASRAAYLRAELILDAAQHDRRLDTVPTFTELVTFIDELDTATTDRSNPA